MSKPWDKLRDKAAIKTGDWMTSVSGARVYLDTFGYEKLKLVDIYVRERPFGATDLRELAEFCVELADQLEGK